MVVLGLPMAPAPGARPGGPGRCPPVSGPSGACSGCVRAAAGAPPHRGGARGESFDALPGRPNLGRARSDLGVRGCSRETGAADGRHRDVRGGHHYGHEGHRDVCGSHRDVCGGRRKPSFQHQAPKCNPKARENYINALTSIRSEHGHRLQQCVSDFRCNGTHNRAGAP